MQLESETSQYKQKLEFDRKVEDIELKYSALEKKLTEQEHQLEMFGRESHRIDNEV